ncbi:MAG: PadR family transcriptional regulator [Chloroflexota bacterium]|nr:PadR family transcriptional regulator [Chloroflexota bacterium]
MSATRLLILGALRFLQPAHGYSVRRELESWNADEWANIAYGSIYFALNKMADEGLLREVAGEPARQGRRPPRVSYVVTERGEEEFQRLLRDYWWDRRPLIDPLQLAASFMDQLPAPERLAVLRHRLLLAEASVAEIDHLLASPLMDLKPAHVRDVFDLSRERAFAEMRWLQRLIDRLAAADGVAAAPPDDETVPGARGRPAGAG